MHFVFDEDVPLLLEATQRMCAQGDGRPVDIAVRCHTKDGGYRWLLLTGKLTARRGDICVINVIMMDITKRKTAEDKLRISEEMLRIAAETDKRALITYDVKANTCHVESRNLFSARFGDTLTDIPDSLLKRGIASGESESELRRMFECIRAGEKSSRSSLLLRAGENSYQWFECNASTVFDADGRPDHAVLVFHNITEQRVKEAVFKKWQQSIESRPPSSYTLFRCNLSKDASLDERNGELLKVVFGEEQMSFNARTKAYVEQYVYPEDQAAYTALLDDDVLLAMYYRGEHTATLEYRENTDDGEPLWRLLTVEMVEYLNSTDIQAFLMYEDIDEKKKAELREIERAETDPLTGIYNRAAFAARIDTLLTREESAQHALLMMDMDGFKQLNDTFGHAAGDQALLDTAAVLRALVRDGDLVCRLGGDEFLIWLRNIPYDAVIGKIARQICEQIHKTFRQAVQVSASVGIAVYPRDGRGYEELYRCADKALYRVKQGGKNNFAFFSTGSRVQPDDEPAPLPESLVIRPSGVIAKRKMVIMDGDGDSRAALNQLFQHEYLIENAKNATKAMLHLRHFSSAVSVMLLDLNTPGIKSLELLKRIKENVDLRTIPVIAIGGDDRDMLLKVIEYGAADYVTKPVDPELIRIRVHSAVSKAENERLLAQNSYLQLQRDEEMKYRTVLDSTGTVVIEYDWRTHVFIYANEISRFIAGRYDHRSLWQVFLADMVADSACVKTLQNALLMLANDRAQSRFTKLVQLKTPENKKHWFRMNVYKRTDSFGLAEKMFITFNDVHEEVLANEKLLFQATRDELTGLYNRAGFLQKAAELIAAKEPGYYVVSSIDIEKFKVLNDQYGTEKGDEILRKFAGALTAHYKDEGGICCRVTADHFALLYPKRLLDAADVETAHREMARPDDHVPALKFYIGRCVADDKTLPVSILYDRATIAKDTVKGRYDKYIATYDDSMRTAILRRQHIISQMNDALRGGQFEVWFQPQFNHTTGMLSGAEALVRWRHPKDGLISPAEFIPIFEQNGFVYEVDKFVWESTCAMLRKWLNEGLRPVPVSVNISRYDVFRDDLIDVVTGLVKKYGLPVDLLRLEITESAFSTSAEQIIRVVKQFVELGFTVEIDDFGSGYSSLNTLKDVPAQIIKMDMRFLENDKNAQRGGSIIESVVRMARWLGMAVIAEGVETIEQADYLKSIGCEYVQGYLYARPTQSNEYERFFAEGRTEAALAHPKTVESWNNNAFWNPMSMETLIFNSYIGGACIFEYHAGKTELLRYNNGYEEIFSAMPDHRLNLSRGDLLASLDEENRTLLQSNIETALQTRRESSCECCFAQNGNRAFFVRVTMRQIAEAGDRSLFYCVVADTTAQRAAERGEREAASRIAAIMDHINGGITAVHTKNGMPEMIFSNDRYYAQLGYTREQFQKEVPTYFNAIHPEDRPFVRHRVQVTLTQKTPCSMEYRCIRRDGSIIHIRSNIALCHIDGIEGDVMITVETDISELVQVQESILETSERLQAIMDNAANGITAVILRKDGTAEYLLVNDRYYELVGYTRELYARAGLTGLELMYPDDLKQYKEKIIGLDRVGDTMSFEFRAKRRDGQWGWLRDDIAVISLKGIDAPVQLSCFTDITARKQADDRLRFVNELASEILSQPDSERAIEHTLRRLLTFCGAERSYLIELDARQGLADNTYEVCAAGVTSEKGRLQHVSFSEADPWYTSLMQRHFYIASDVNKIQDDALRSLLSAQGIRSIVLAPLWRDKHLIGFAGVDNPAGSLEDFRRLTAPADFLALLLTRRDLNRDIERSSAEMAQLINDTPGGFCRLAICPGTKPRLVSMNEGFCRMLGMTSREVYDRYGDDMYKCFVREDVAASIQESRNARHDERQYSARCRLRQKDGSLLWATAFGRFVRGADGGTFLNIYFSDVTEQMEAERRRMELLDSLPGGAALYAYDGRELSVIHINRRYFELVGRAPASSLNASALDMVHPDDRMAILREIDDAIRQKRDAHINIRIHTGSEGYKQFHVSASISPMNGKYTLAVSFIPAAAPELKEILPAALSAMLAASKDITFIKDQDRRYIACSRSALKAVGLSEHDIIGKTSAEVFGGETAETLAKEDELICQTGRPLLDYALRLPVSAGGCAAFRASKYPLLDSAGKVIGIYCLLQSAT